MRGSTKWRLLILLVTGAFVACAPKFETTYKAAASTAYYKQLSYEHVCQNTGGHFPASCPECEKVLAKAAWLSRAGEQAVKIGFMDPQLSQQLDQLLVELQACP